MIRSETEPSEGVQSVKSKCYNRMLSQISPQRPIPSQTNIGVITHHISFEDAGDSGSGDAHACCSAHDGVRSARTSGRGRGLWVQVLVYGGPQRRHRRPGILSVRCDASSVICLPGCARQLPGCGPTSFAGRIPPPPVLKLRKCCDSISDRMPGPESPRALRCWHPCKIKNYL